MFLPYLLAYEEERRKNEELKKGIQEFLSKATLLPDQDDEGVVVRCIGCGELSPCWEVKHLENCPIVKLQELVK